MEEQGIDVAAYMRDGKLVPREIVQSVLEENLVSSVRAGKSDILLDGFPRSMDQTKLFEASVSAEYPSRAAVRAVDKSADKHVGCQDQGSTVVPGLQGDFACPSTQPREDLWPG